MTVITEGNYADEALFAMKSRPPNADGTIGVTIPPDMPEWRAWLCYFLGKRMDVRASYMRNRGRNGYMVPCRNPGDFDTLGVQAARQEYTHRVHNGELRPEDTGKKSSEMTAAERQDVLNRLARVSPMFAKFAIVAQQEAAA